MVKIHTLSISFILFFIYYSTFALSFQGFRKIKFCVIVKNTIRISKEGGKIFKASRYFWVNGGFTLKFYRSMTIRERDGSVRTYMQNGGFETSKPPSGTVFSILTHAYSMVILSFFPDRNPYLAIIFFILHALGIFGRIAVHLNIVSRRNFIIFAAWKPF